MDIKQNGKCTTTAALVYSEPLWRCRLVHHEENELGPQSYIRTVM